MSTHAIPQAVFAAILSSAADAIVTVEERHTIVLFFFTLPAIGAVA